LNLCFIVEEEEEEEDDDNDDLFLALCSVLSL
jgi:hypothetical protein